MQLERKHPFNQCAIAIAVSLLFQPHALLANPTGAQVVNGAVNMTKPNASTLNVTNSPGAIINWQGFSIGAGETTRFIQQSSSSAVLNRVVGAELSAINGQLLSNGRVFLINPAGILIGPTGAIDTAGFVGSTLNLQNADFLAGKLRFSGDATSGAIINQGWIRTSYGGNVLLIAPRIENSGLIQTPGGELILAAGQKLTVSSLDQEGVQFEVQAPADAVVNVGRLLADGGAVGVFAGTLKHSGDIRANAITRDEGGRIVLQARGDVTLTAGSTISADGKVGGAVTVQSQTGTTLVSGEVSAKGSDGKGGDIRLLGTRVGVIDNAVIDASGERGGGQVLVGGDYQGRNAAVQNAARTFTGVDTALRADAKTDGDGGKVIVWSDEVTRVNGAMSARGGAASGNGGLIETSGKQELSVGDTARVDMRAPHGQGGNWLLDPHNITVQTGGVAATTDADQFSDTPAADVTISPATLAGVTSGTISLQANNDITFTDAVTLSNAVGLNAIAGRSILVNNNLTGNNASLQFFANSNSGALIAANRDAGAAVFTMAAGTTITATNNTVRVQILPGVGGASGDITLANINANNVSVEHIGPTPNGSILRQTGGPVLTVANTRNVHLEIEANAGGAGSSIGTSANPIAVNTAAGGTAILEAHYHAGGAGIFVDALTSLQVGGATTVFFGGVKGVQTLAAAGAAGPVRLNALGNLTQLTGTAVCGAGGGTGGPICAGAAGSTNPADVLTLRATDLNLGMTVAGNSVILLPQAGGTIGIAGGAGTLSLSALDFALFNTKSLRIGEAASGNIIFGGNITMPVNSTVIDFRSGGTITTTQGANTTDITGSGAATNILLTGSVIGATGTGRVKVNPGASNVTTNSTGGGTFIEHSVGTMPLSQYSFALSGFGAPLELATTDGNINAGFSSGGVANISLITGGIGRNIVFNSTGTSAANSFTLSPTGATTFDSGTQTFDTPVTTSRPVIIQGGTAKFNQQVFTSNLLSVGSGNVTFASTVNASTIAGGLTVTGGSATFGGIPTFSGPMSFTGGTATFNQPVITFNSLSVGGGAVTFAQNVTGNTINGSLSINSGSATFNGTSSFGGPFTLSGTGAATFNALSTYANGVLIQNGTLGGTGAVAVNGGVTMENGTLGGTGAVTINGGLIWQGGTISNTNASGVTANGGLIVNTGTPVLTGILTTDALSMGIPTGTLTIGTNGVLTLNGASPGTLSSGAITISNQGTLRFTGVGGFSMEGTASLAINNGGLLDFQSNASILSAGGAPGVVANSGTVRKSAGTGTSRIGLNGAGNEIAFTNAAGATIDVQTGTLQTGSAFTTNSGIIRTATGATFSTNNTSLLNNTTGILTGTGTLQVGAGQTLTNNGFIRPGTSPGTLTINGNLALNPGSKIDVELQAPGITPGTDYDRITVTGNANLDGTLNVTHLGGFAPTAGQNFQIMNYASRAGDFATKNFPVGFPYTATPNATNYVLTSTVVGINSWLLDGDGNWNAPTNWSLGHTPLATEQVVIDRPAGLFTITVPAGTFVADRVTSNENLTLNGSTLTLAGNSSVNNATLAINGGTLTANGPLTATNLSLSNGATLNGTGAILVNGAFNWSTAASLSFVSGSGLFTTAGTSTLSGVVPNSHRLEGRVWNNTGTASLTGGHLSLNSGATFNNSGTFNVTTASPIGIDSTGAGTNTFNNSGTLNWNTPGAAGISVINAFNNTGNVNVNGGMMQVSVGGTHSGAFNVASTSAALNLTGGTHNLLTGANFTSAGTVDFSGTQATNFAPGSTYASTGTTTLAGGNLTFNQTGPVTFANLTVTGGTLAGNTPLSVSGAFNWSAGTMADSGLLSTAGTSTISGAGVKSLAGPWTNAGTATLTGGAVTVNGQMNNGGTLNVNNTALTVNGLNQSAGLTSITAGSILSSSAPVSVAGALQVATGGTLNAAGQTVAVTGTLNVSGTVTAATVHNSGVLRGTGTVAATLNNDGTVAPGASPGTLLVNGNFNQGTNGTLAIELGGPLQGFSYDLFQVTGTATLGGALSVTTVNGFTPAVGNLFDFMTYNNRVGNFSVFNPPAGIGMQFNPLATLYQAAVTTVAVASSAGTSVASDIVNTVVSDQNRLQQTIPNDEGEQAPPKKPLVAPQCT